MRFVSKLVAELITPLLFDEVTLAPTLRHLEFGKLICQNFAPSIKTIIISPATSFANAEPFVWEDFMDIANVLNVEDSQRFTQSIIRDSYIKYRRYREAAHEILTEGEFDLLLCHMLGTAPNVKTFILTNKLPTIRLRDSEQITSEDEVIFSDVFHEETRRETIFDLRGPFQKMLLVMATADCKIKELIMDVMFPPEAFSLSPRQQSHAERIVPFLTKLKLEFCVGDNGMTFMKARPCSFLAGAVNLKALSIDMGDHNKHSFLPAISPVVLDERQKFEAILNGCSYRNLETFIVSSFHVKAHELLRFLECSTRLKHLVIEGCYLFTGYWYTLIDCIRKTPLSLETILVNGIEGGLLEPENHPVKWRDYDDQVESYMFKNGPNPFAIASLKIYYSRWKLDNEDTQKMLIDKFSRHKARSDEQTRRLF